MRVVHCGVLAARTSLFIWIVRAVGSCLHTSCFDQNPTHARDLYREGCIAFSYNVRIPYTLRKKNLVSLFGDGCC